MILLHFYVYSHALPNLVECEKMMEKNYECFSDNSCNSIRTKKNWKLIMKNTTIDMGVVFIRQPITDDHKLNRMGVFYCVCKVLSDLKEY